MIKAYYRKKILSFLKPAETSRGVMHHKPSWYIFLVDEVNPEIKGIGECPIIPGLSAETEEKVDRKIKEICQIINQGNIKAVSELPDFPSIGFGIETALHDLRTGGKRELFTTDFTAGRSCIRINGLIWMGTKDAMLKQVEEKLNQGFRCLKLKIGSRDPGDELQMLKSLRSRFTSKELELRVDANGAFEPRVAMDILRKLAEVEIHSIEQPIRPGQWEEMAKLCMNSPVHVALDEELLGKHTVQEKQSLISAIRPHYLVLKPGLLGGFRQTIEYLALAKQENIGWWITSALESNIGLNAIAQWAFTLNSPMVQGLGTGRLYRQNVLCPLVLEGDKLFYYPQKGWNLSFIES
jgi:O-succinylbenzoate synthase